MGDRNGSQSTGQTGLGARDARCLPGNARWSMRVPSAPHPGRSWQSASCQSRRSHRAGASVQDGASAEECSLRPLRASGAHRAAAASRSRRTEGGSASIGSVGASRTPSRSPGRSGAVSAKSPGQSRGGSPAGGEQLERSAGGPLRSARLDQDLGDLAPADHAGPRVALSQRQPVIVRSGGVEPAGPDGRVGRSAGPHRVSLSVVSSSSGLRRARLMVVVTLIEVISAIRGRRTPSACSTLTTPP